MSGGPIFVLVDIGYPLEHLVFWGGAVFFAYLAKDRFKKKYWLSGCLLIPMALFSFLLPHWGQFPGRRLAEGVCRDIGGAHTLRPLPIEADSIYFEGSGDIDFFRLPELLLQDGFQFIESSAVPELGRGIESVKAPDIWMYGIEPVTGGRCVLDPKESDSQAAQYTYFYQRGMKFDECLVRRKHAGSMASVKYTSRNDERIFPTRMSVRHQEYSYAATSAPISWQNSFYYYTSDPYRSPDAVDCHHYEFNKFANPAGIVNGTGIRKWPGEAILPVQVGALAINRPLSIKRVESRISKQFDGVPGIRRVESEGPVIHADQYLAYFWNAMDLRADGVRAWLPFGDRFGKTRISWGVGTQATTVEVPGFNEEARHRWPNDTAIAPKIEEGGVKVLAAKLQDGQLYLIRSNHGMWEISDYDIQARAWRRYYVDLVAGEDHSAIVGFSDAFHPLITSWEIDSGGITVNGLALRHEDGPPVNVDQEFTLEFILP